MRTIIALIFFVFINLSAQELGKVNSINACSDMKIDKIATLLGWEANKIEIEPMELSDETMSSSCKFTYAQEELTIDIEDLGAVDVMPTHINHYVISEGSYDAETEFLVYEMNRFVQKYHVSIKLKTKRSDEGMYELLEGISNQIELKSQEGIITYKF